MKVIPYSFSQLAKEAMCPVQGNFVVAVSLAIALNSVILNSIIGAHSKTVTSGDFSQASRINVLLALTSQFNITFLIFAASICTILLYTSLSAIYDSRKHNIKVMRLCGLSIKEIISYQTREAVRLSVKAALIAAVVFVPSTWAYNMILPVLGLAPRGVFLGLHFESVVVCSLFVMLFLIGVAMAKPKQLYQFDNRTRLAAKSSIKHVLPFLLLLLAGLLLFLPLSPVADDTRMILVLPWAAILVLLYGTKLVYIFGWILTSKIRKTGRAPRLAIAVARLQASMKSRVNPVLPLTIVLAFVVPLSAVMATGRNASLVNVYAAVQAQTIADLRQENIAPEMQRLNSKDSQSIYIATSVDIYRQDNPYAASQPLFGATDISRLQEFFPEVKVESGDANSIDGNVVAVTDSWRSVGDTIHIVTGDKTLCVLTVGAVVKLPSVIQFDYLANDVDLACPAANFGRLMAFSHRSPDSLRAVLEDANWTITTKDQWVNQGANETVNNQRSALITMFVIPTMIALFVTATAIKSRRKTVYESSRVLAQVGATNADFQRIAIIEAVLAAVSAALLLAIVIILSAGVILPVAMASKVAITFDYQLDALFIAISLSIILFIHVLTGRSQERNFIGGSDG